MKTSESEGDCSILDSTESSNISSPKPQKLFLKMPFLFFFS